MPDPSIIWLDDDANYLRGAVSLLGLRPGAVTFAASVEEAMDAVSGLRFVPIVLLDAVVPINRSERDGSWRTQSRRLSADLEPTSRSWLERRPRIAEEHGRCFIEECERRGIQLGRVILVSFVPESLLRTRLRYKFDCYVQKLNLPDEAERLGAMLKLAAVAP